MRCKPTGFHPALSWYRNHFTPQFNRQGGKITLCGHAVLDLAPTASLQLSSELVIGGNLRRGSRAETFLKLHDNGVFRVKQRFQLFFGASVEVTKNACLTVGKGYLNTGSSIMCTQSITLGNGVFVARNVYITDSDHHALLDTEGNPRNLPAPVRIGDHVWIGYGAVILKGVSIGDGAVIAAGSVVTRDIPARCLAAGVPARVIRENVIWN